MSPNRRQRRSESLFYRLFHAKPAVTVLENALPTIPCPHQRHRFRCPLHRLAIEDVKPARSHHGGSRQEARRRLIGPCDIADYESPHYWDIAKPKFAGVGPVTGRTDVPRPLRPGRPRALGREKSPPWVLDFTMNEDHKPETDATTAPKISASSDTSPSTSCPSKPAKSPNAASSIRPPGTTATSSNSSLKFEMRLPWGSGQTDYLFNQARHRCRRSAGIELDDY